MAKIKMHKSDKERICRICEKVIGKNETSIVIEGCKVGNKKVNIHFHYDCIYPSVQHVGNYEELNKANEWIEKLKKLEYERESWLDG